METTFVCLNCGFEDIGNYCSRCGSELKIQPNNIFDLISRRLEDIGFLSLRSELDLIEIGYLELNNIPIIWLLLRQYNCIAGILFLRKSLENIPLSNLSELLEISRNLFLSNDLVLEERRMISIISLIEAEQSSLQDLLSIINCFYAGILPHKNKLKRHKIFNVSVNTIFVYNHSPSSNQVKAIKRNSKKQLSLSCSVNLFSTFIDLSQRKFAAHRFFLCYNQINSSLKQIELLPDSSSSQSSSWWDSFKEFFAIIIEPFEDYLIGASKINRISFLAKLILAEKISLSRLSNLGKYILGSTFVTTIIGAFFSIEVGWFGIPIVDEMLDLSIFLLGGLIIAAISHFPLKWAGGSGRFRYNLTAAVYVNVTFYPILTLAEAVYSQISNGESPPASSWVISTMYLCSLLSIIYKISYRRAFMVVMFLLPCAIFLVMGILFIVFFIVFGQ